MPQMPAQYLGGGPVPAMTPSAATPLPGLRPVWRMPVERFQSWLWCLGVEWDTVALRQGPAPREVEHESSGSMSNM